MKQDHPDLSVRRQCSLLSLARSGLYYQPRGESAENLKFMTIIDRKFLETPLRSVPEARRGIGAWISYYTEKRPHSSHGLLTPAEAHDTANQNLRTAA